MTFEELQAIHYHWRLAIDQIEEGVVIVEGGFDDPHTLQLVYANRAFLDHLGLDVEQVVGAALADFLPPSEIRGWGDHWGGAVENRQNYLQSNCALRGRNGETVPAQWTVSSRIGFPGRVPDHTITLLWCPPAHAELTERNAFEKNKADIISQIAKGIVHDFNNSLAAIRGHLEVALSGSVGDEDSVRKALEATDTTAKLCQRLLTYARGDREEKRPCAVTELVQQAVSIACLGSGITCKINVPPDLWPVRADGIQIVQVINNLLMNAQQAMPSGGLIGLTAENKPAGEANCPALPPGDYVAIKVRDRGIGIPEELQDKIFHSLFTTKPGGTGLGLSTCARIVANHDGYIDVTSAPNRGSEFVVYLPAALGVAGAKARHSESVEGETEEAPTPPGVTPTQLKVLLIEDQAGIAQIAETYLAQLGHEVIWVEEGQRGVGLFRDAWRAGDPFDVAIIDLTLPGGMSGEDTFRDLQRIDPDVIAIATSGSLDDGLCEAYRKRGFAAILPKPFALQRLGDVLHEALACHAA